MTCILPWPVLIWVVLLAPKGVAVARKIGVKARNMQHAVNFDSLRRDLWNG